ncbi:RNA polymerase sigma-70 factor, ECF subfamily [Amycolatopsis xylanica]|uniref:RNA polymerase sigma-70 factor, ECF subfamily n=1 Tax=Amycolatopsis xylanica TaxID=589385 RepID=A0A1H2W9S3_9PSEU|nr:RNA polymerase sigma factor [Amycolatopsis xylanica]SDW77206.1 RNA polymerase sigma-70 factor, ECF subfamily [Amycolatopsis xylanica]
MSEQVATFEDDQRQLAGLVKNAQHGDLLAMNSLLERLHPYVSRLCGPIALQEGPDAAQDAMIIIFRSLHQLKEPGALYGWVRAIAVREAIRTAKRNQRSEPAELTEVPARDDPALGVEIRDVLKRLSPEHRAVLVLRDLEGLDQSDLAALLNIPAATVRTRLFRARRSFRSEWQR